MIDHDGARGLMAQAVEGRISGDDERELALHLVACDECKTLYEGLQQAHPALTSIPLGEPSVESVDHAVHRAGTVLRGEADPGPMGVTEEPPRLPDLPDSNTIRIDTSLPRDDEFVTAGPATATGPMPPDTSPAAAWPVEPPQAHVRPIDPDVQTELDALDLPLLGDEDDLSGPFAAAPVGPESPVFSTGIPPASTEQVVEQQTEIDRLLEEDRGRYEQLPYEDEGDDRDRMGPVPWLIAIAVTVVLAVLAGILITRGEGLFGGGGDLPAADEVRGRIARAFRDMKSLKASFDVQKLNLYRVAREDNSLVYSFSNGRFAGSIDYDRAEAGYHQEYALSVREDEVDRVDVVQTSDETRSLTGTGNSRRALVEQNPPLGPPDGMFRPTFGLLEDSLGTAARLLSEATDLQVAGTTERDGVELFEVTASVRPNELSRADRIEAALDSNFFPVIVERSISRENARVLAPEEAIADDDLDKAFGDNERITTEFIELRNVQYDEIVLPGDLVLDVPDGVQEQVRDLKFERLTRAELPSKLDFEPLLPRTLPDGYEDQLLAIYTGEPEGWGPNKSYPKPDSVFHSTYFDGKTTISVTQRRLAQTFTLRGSPLQRAGLPITVRNVDRGEQTFFYGVSPEVPPHMYGFLGNTFVMVSGYAPQSELVRVLSSLAETPVAVPTPINGSPGPTTSPGASPAGIATPAASPLATATPIG